MAVIIAIANHKGGVGKTSSVASISAVLASRGYKTLIVDLDTQANLSRHYMPSLPDRIIYHAIRERKDIPIYKLSSNLDLVPSGLDMAGIELEMTMMMRREYVLQDLIKPIEHQYDFILLDCPPSLGLITMNALTIANVLIVPMLADLMSSYGLDMMDSFCVNMQSLNPGIHINYVFFNSYKGNENISNVVSEDIRKRYGSKVLKQTIRKNVAIAEAPFEYQSVLSYNPSSNGAKDYIALTDEILTRLKSEGYEL